jgi:exodeoxyribonuclease-5
MVTQIALTHDQEKAISEIRLFLASENRMMVLEGFAGTGKTTITSLLVEELSQAGKAVVVTAPTHKAVSVLRSKIPHADLSTIHSLLKLKIQERADGTTVCEPTNAAPLLLRGIDLLVVDECSMIDSMLLDRIVESTPNTKVLFVGDPAQLPPVSPSGETGLSPVFSLISEKVRLTHIVRQAADNPILALSAQIREWMDRGYIPTLSDLEKALPVPPSKAGLMTGDATHAIAFEHQEGRDTRILCYTNRRVLDYNRRVHEILHPGDPRPFVPGQTVVFQSEHEAIERKTIRNNEEVEITALMESSHPKWPEIPAWFVSITHPEYGPLSVYFPKHPAALDRTVKGLFDDYRRLTTDKSDRDSVAEGRHCSMQAWALKKAFADIRATYAQTVHKSQGSTFHTVFIDWNDLLMLAGRSKTEFLRCLYTAVTRPAEHLAICY